MITLTIDNPLLGHKVIDPLVISGDRNLLEQLA
jgi:hypothetical protein